MTAEFDVIAASLREAVLDHYRADRDSSLTGATGENTLETNSGWVARRSAPLVEMLRGRGVATLDGVDVVDLGCGFGAMSVYLAAQGARVTGVDPHEPRLAVGSSVAERHGLDARFVQGRMQDLGALADTHFDVAVQNNSYCYIVERDERRDALAETLRVLRPGGWLVTRNPNRWHPVDQFTRLPLLPLLRPGLADSLATRFGRSRSRVRLTSPLAARRELRAAGFEAIRHEGFPDRRRPSALKVVARYQHFTARRPGGQSPKSG